MVEFLLPESLSPDYITWKRKETATDTFHDSLWHATAAPAPDLRPRDGDDAADVAIVGAGYLGLSTALHLAGHGARVVVVEAREPGFGASGRNTGFVVPSFVTPIGPKEVEATLGRPRAERLCRLVGGAGRRVFDLVKRHRIRCDASEAGWLQPAHSRERLDLLRRRQADWARHGKTLTLLERDETARLTGFDSYHGALLDPGGGHVNPLGYARGLARAALAAGATIRVGAPVTAIRRGRQGWVLETPSGRIVAERAVLATNALTGPLAPQVARSTVPLVVHQVATRPLDSESRGRILPGNHCLSDTRRDIFALRWTPDGRLVTGGVAALAAGAPGRLRRSLLARLGRLLPLAGPVEAEYAWSGVICLTRDFLPRVFEVDRDLFAATGCNGRGLALSTALGEELAAFLAGGDRASLSVPISPPAPIRGHFAARHLPSVMLPWARLRDRLEAGTGRGRPATA